MSNFAHSLLEQQSSKVRAFLKLLEEQPPDLFQINLTPLQDPPQVRTTQFVLGTFRLTLEEVLPPTFHDDSFLPGTIHVSATPPTLTNHDFATEDEKP